MWLGIEIGFWTLFFLPLSSKTGCNGSSCRIQFPQGLHSGIFPPSPQNTKKNPTAAGIRIGEKPPLAMYYIWTLCTRSLHASLINLIDQFYSTLGHTNTQILTHTKAMGSPLNSIKFNWQKEMNMSMQKTKKHKKQMHVPHTLYSVHIVYHTIHEKQINGGTEHNG